MSALIALLALYPTWKVSDGSVPGTSVVAEDATLTTASIVEAGVIRAPLRLGADRIRALRGVSAKVRVTGAPVTFASERWLMGSSHMSGEIAQPTGEWQTVVVTTDAETEMTPKPLEPNAPPSLSLVIVALGDATVEIGEVTTW